MKKPYKYLRFSVLLLVFCLVPIHYAISGTPQEGHVYVESSRVLILETIKIDPLSLVHYPISGLPPGADLVIVLNSVSGGTGNDINVYFVDEVNLQNKLNERTFSYFTNASGLAKTKAVFKTKIPQEGNYYLIFENFTAASPKIVTFEVITYPGLQEEQEEAKRGGEGLYSILKYFFIFPDFTISIKTCGTMNAFSDSKGNITLCTELLIDLVKKGLGQSALWIFFHEFGHSLLKLWQYPFQGGEDVADEFATVLSLMFKQTQAIEQAIQEWKTHDSKGEAKGIIRTGDRHVISIQRARNIENWLNNPNDLMRRWQKILVPNMQTEALGMYLAEPEPWCDIKLIREELTKRGVL